MATIKQRERWPIQDGIEFLGDCAYIRGQLLAKDKEGIYWIGGTGYYLSPRGRETPFCQGLPMMRPGYLLTRRENGTWEVVKGNSNHRDDPRLIAQFFGDLCQRFYDSVASYEGYLAMGSMFAYSAAPEIFDQYGLFPGLFVHGQMGSGKSKVCEWLMRIRGFKVTEGVSLLQGTPVGLMCDNENHSNEPVWVNEFVQGQIDPAKEAILQDAFNRGHASKWLPPDAVPRTMRTNFIISGESTSSKAAMRSRCVHVQVSAARRRQHMGDGERAHFEWMESSKEAIFTIGRFLHENREAFVGQLQDCLEEWLSSPLAQSLNEREKMVHGIAWGAWQALATLLDSMAPGASGDTHAGDFLLFAIEHARASAEDVTAETNINVFLQDLLTAFKADAIPHTCFRVESDYALHPPGWPNQAGGWKSYRLYLDPDQTISAVNIYLTKERRALTLRRKDLQSQLSKTDYWIEGKLRKPFGPDGQKVAVACWGLDLDKMGIMGRQECTDAAYNEWLLHPKGDDEMSDPRKGPFYAIVTAIEKAKEEMIAAKH